jgi:hypothetical protein
MTSNTPRGKPQSQLLTPWRTSSAVLERCRIPPSPLRALELADGRSIRSHRRPLPGEASQERRRKVWERNHPHPRVARSRQESRRLQQAAWPRNGLAPPVAREVVRERGVPDRSLEQGGERCFETCFVMKADEVWGKGERQVRTRANIWGRLTQCLEPSRTLSPGAILVGPESAPSILSKSTRHLNSQHNHARQKSEGPLRRW